MRGIFPNVGKALDFFRQRKQSYQAFKAAAGVPFLRDLADFCCANSTCLVKDKNGAIDKDAMLILEGRREVWLRVQNHFNLTSQQLLQLYTGSDYLTEKEEDQDA